MHRFWWLHGHLGRNFNTEGSAGAVSSGSDRAPPSAPGAGAPSSGGGGSVAPENGSDGSATSQAQVGGSGSSPTNGDARGSQGSTPGAETGGHGGSTGSNGAAAGAGSGDAAAGDAGKADGKGGIDYSLTALQPFLLEGLEGEAAEKAKGYLGRHANLQSVVRSAMNADQRITEATKGRVKIPTGENDDPKEIEAFRKAMGIPEKPEAYELPKGEGGAEVPETERALWNQVLPSLHAAGYSQKQIEAAYQAQAQVGKMAQEAIERAATERAQAAAQVLRQQHGSDLDGKMALANRTVGERFPDLGPAVLEQRLSDGTRLGDHPSIVNMMLEWAAAMGDDGNLHDVGAGGQTLEQAEAELRQTTERGQKDLDWYQREGAAVAARQAANVDRLRARSGR